MKKRKNFTTEEKATILMAIEESGSSIHAWCKANKINRSNIDRWLKDPAIKAAKKKQPVVKLSKEVIDLSKDTEPERIFGHEVVFDDNEHRIIRFACASLREILESVMYKLAATDVVKK